MSSNKSKAAAASAVVHDHRFTWNTCTELNEKKRILIKEKALEAGLEHCEKLIATVRASFESISALDAEYAQSTWPDDERQKWIQDCEDVKRRSMDFAVLVGVAGRTGSGKTSALNALLGYRELLPTSNDAAATSVVCKVSYNYDDRPEYAFRASVVFRKEAELIEQLEQFFKDLKGRNELQESHNGSIEDEDALRSANADLKSNLEMVNVVFGLEEDEVENMTAQELLDSSPDVKKVIGTEKHFHDSDVASISERIKPYMDSMEAAHTSSGLMFAAWPLIDEVQLFVKSDVLRNGVVLVDLPGIGDATESRAAVAEKYYRKLAATLIITQAPRAADESTSFKLMSDHHEMEMKLDGKFHKKTYCVVLSHIDQIDRTAALRKVEAKSNLQLQDYIQREIKLKTQKQARGKKLKDGMKQLKKLLKDQKLANTNLEMGRKPGVSKSTQPKGKVYRGRLAKAIKNQQEYNTKLDKRLKRLKRELDTLNGKITFICIKARNEFLERRIQRDFKRRQARMVTTNQSDLRDTYDGKVSIHPTSSRAFWQCFNQEEPLTGFPDVSYSGIPSLANWIREATILERENHVEALLRDLQIYFNLVQLWSRDKWDENKIDTNKLWLQTEIFQPLYDSMKTRLDSHWMILNETVRKLNPLEEKDTSSQKCANKLIRIVNNWSYKYPSDATSRERIHWVTYQAIVERRGKRFVSKGQKKYTYNWMEDIADVLLDIIVEDWNKALNHEIPACANPSEKEICIIWSKFIEELKFRVGNSLPDLSPHIDRELGSLDVVKQKVKGQMRRALQGISKDASHIHSSLVKTMQKKWNRAFNAASEVSGSGSFKKRQDIIREYAGTGGLKAFDAAFSRMEKDLGEEFKKLDRNLGGVSSLAVHAVKTHINMLLDRALGLPEGTAKLEDVVGLKVKLQQDIRTILLNWALQWRVSEDNSCLGPQAEDIGFPQEYEKIKAEDDDGDIIMETDDDDDDDDDDDTD